MPKASTLSRAVDTATKCLATASVLSPSLSSMAPASTRLRHNHSRAIRAFVRVSSVVKVLLATMKRVVSGSRSAVVSATSVGSMFETKRHSRPSCT